MSPLLLDFANLLVAALIVGALFGARLFLNPSGLDGKSYLAIQRHGIRTMNPVMPLVGWATIVLTLTSAVFARRDRVRLSLLLASALCFVSIGLVTRLVNQRINASVITWHDDSLPSNWTGLRDKWWRWHLIRLALGLLGLSLVIVATLKRNPPNAAPADDNSPNALILDKQEGERRIHRSAGTVTGTAPFILKVDPKNGGSKHLVLFTEDLPPGAAIPRHMHPEAEEILMLQTGRTLVHLGDKTKEVGPGATVFIPQNTWISAEVVGAEPVSLVAVFSEPGFEDYMREISVRESDPNSPMSKPELDAVRARYPHAVGYK